MSSLHDRLVLTTEHLIIEPLAHRDIDAFTTYETGNFAPELTVVERFSSGSLTPGMLTFFLPRMWRYRLGDFPVPVVVWRAMFEFAEYTENMVVQRRRRGTRVAFRGATQANREGL